MYRKYYSYNDMPKPILSPDIEQTREIIPAVKEVAKSSKPLLEKDDIILIAVLLTLILNGCDDKLLIIAVAALLVM